MKTLIKITIVLLAGIFVLGACTDDFDEVNVDPKAASVDQVQVEYLLNNSIIGAQQNPHVAERAFVLYWFTTARMHRYPGGIALGGYSDGWSSDYYNDLSGWLKSANLAISVAEEKQEVGSDMPYTENQKQIARIWRAYLMSEYADNFGPMPIDAFSGVNPEFSDLEDVYTYMLDELKDAVATIDPDAPRPDNIRDFDAAYGYDYNKWIKYGNSLRMRFAMRVSEAAPSLAQTHFEEAAASLDGVISTADDIFKVREQDGWDDVTGVMSRPWNYFMLSPTVNNLYIGLGGIPSDNFVSEEFQAHIKDEGYMGLKFEDHLSMLTNDPSAGFWYDGLHPTIDPRAYKAYVIPGDFDNPEFYSQGPSDDTEKELLDENDEVLLELDVTGHWNAPSFGSLGDKGARTQLSDYGQTIGGTPRLASRFRTSDEERIFFADWESYFLIAEAAVRGWSVPLSAQEAYEEGVRASFNYWNISEYADDYLASESYNRVGTSVSFTHTDEPESVTLSYIDGYTGDEGTYEFSYPENHLYKDGTVSNDYLTKIITQKYLAQLPWLPLEAWNDQRRLGLPFFENPVVEDPVTNLPDLTASTSHIASIRHLPQRLPYPSGLRNSNPDGYEQAVSLLNGDDAVLTPLWWAIQE
ncbi:SusD/RagB family nutrient-binding outer membrane lipoprotein [Marinilabiliaceae bacterium ANBcel2]|nr:SusD/RagB family nutrient-binding outer membrane lipoprotein [Marinilabiliaceae bacterium ANBcel2]